MAHGQQQDFFAATDSMRRILPLSFALLISGRAVEAGQVEVLTHEPTEMVYVGQGSVSMGVPEGEEELAFILGLCIEDFRSTGERVCSQQENLKSASTVREVYIDRFAIDRHEVVVSDYRRCVYSGACDIDPLLFGDPRYQKNTWPIVNVRWQDAADYCAWRDKRLPTEAEWEKAARGPHSTRFPWGNEWAMQSANHGQLSYLAELRRLSNGPMLGIVYELFASAFHGPDASDGYAGVAPPGAMTWGASPYGAMDMAGNVAEWVLDYYSEEGYADLALSNPIRSNALKQDKRRAVRGGSWMMPRVLHLSYLRHGRLDAERNSDLGFRCAKSL